MKKRMHSVLSVILSLLTVFTVMLPCISAMVPSADAAIEFAKKYKTGDYLYFGSYPQDEVTDSSLKTALNTAGSTADANGDFTYNGNKYRKYVWRGNTHYYIWQPVKWRVLSVSSSGEVLILAYKILDYSKYHSSQTYITWENCTLRAWLNGTFYNQAFTTNEKADIITSHNENRNGPSNNTNGGNATDDKVFILSYYDAKNSSYGFSSTTRKASRTPYAAGKDGSTSCTGGYDWWLRTPGHYSNSAYGVNYDGVYYYTSYVDNTRGVRPALKLNLESSICKSNHQNIVDRSMPATCTEEGIANGKFCTDCNKYISGTVIPATGHAWGSGSVTKAANCVDKGVKTFTCSNCKKTKTEEIAIDTSNHKYSYVSAKNPTCTADGYTAHNKCTLCGNIDDNYTIAKAGHSYNVTWLWKTDRSSATATFTCSTCGYSKKATAYKSKGTITSETTKKATCTTSGQTTYTATVTYGGKKYTCTKTNTIAKLGHSYGTAQWTWNATVDSATAKYGKPCKRCDYVYGKTATVTASVTKKATTSASGTVKYTAKVTDGTRKTNTKTVTIPKISSGKLSYTKTTYNGSKKSPTLTVKDSNGNTISKDNYNVTGLTHTIPGTYKVTVTFKNRYTGTKTLSYTINKHSAKADGNKVTWTAMPIASKYEVYVDDARKITTTKTSYTVKDCGSHNVYVIGVFKDRTKSKKSYTTVVTVNNAHVWDDSGAKCKNCGAVNNENAPGKVTGFRQGTQANALATLEWSRVSGADGYMVENFDKDISEWVVLTPNGVTQPGIGLSERFKGVHIWRVRAFKVVNGNKIYGEYSEITTTTI